MADAGGRGSDGSRQGGARLTRTSGCLLRGFQRSPSMDVRPARDTKDDGILMSVSDQLMGLMEEAFSCSRVAKGAAGNGGRKDSTGSSRAIERFERGTASSFQVGRWERVIMQDPITIKRSSTRRVWTDDSLNAANERHSPHIPIKSLPYDTNTQPDLVTSPGYGKVEVNRFALSSRVMPDTTFRCFNSCHSQREGPPSILPYTRNHKLSSKASDRGRS